MTIHYKKTFIEIGGFYNEKILAFILSAVMCLSLCSCNSGSSDNEDTLFHNGLLAVELDGKWGYINEKGETVINPQFDHAYGFCDDGYAVVIIDDKYGVINSKDEMIVQPIYNSVNQY